MMMAVFASLAASATAWAGTSLPPLSERSLEMHLAPAPGLPVQVTQLTLHYSPSANTAQFIAHFSGPLPVPSSTIAPSIVVGLADPTTTYCVFNDKAAPQLEVTTQLNPTGPEVAFSYPDPTPKTLPSVVLSENREELLIAVSGHAALGSRNYICAFFAFYPGIGGIEGNASQDALQFIPGYEQFRAQLLKEEVPLPHLSLAKARAEARKKLLRRYRSFKGFLIRCLRQGDFDAECRFRRQRGTETLYGSVSVGVNRTQSGKPLVETMLTAHHKYRPVKHEEASLPAWVEAANKHLPGIAEQLASEAPGGQVSEIICPNNPERGQYICGVSARFPGYVCREEVLFTQRGQTEAIPTVSRPRCS